MAAKKKTEEDVNNARTAAILSYLLVGIIWYFTDEQVKKNEITGHHVKQAINLYIWTFALTIICGMLIFIGWMLIPFIQFAAVVLGIIGIINAMNGKKLDLPMIGGFASKYLTF